MLRKEILFKEETPSDSEIETGTESKRQNSEKQGKTQSDPGREGERSRFTRTRCQENGTWVEKKGTYLSRPRTPLPRLRAPGPPLGPGSSHTCNHFSQEGWRLIGANQTPRPGNAVGSGPAL